MYQTIQKLGQGGFGKVYLCKEKATGIQYAIKYIDISFFMSKADLVKEIFRESKTLSVLQHKRIVDLKRTFLYNNNIVLIMDYAPGGELKKYVMDNKGVEEVSKYFFISQIYIHLPCEGYSHQIITNSNFISSIEF